MLSTLRGALPRGPAPPAHHLAARSEPWGWNHVRRIRVAKKRSGNDANRRPEQVRSYSVEGAREAVVGLAVEYGTVHLGERDGEGLYGEAAVARASRSERPTEAISGSVQVHHGIFSALFLLRPKKAFCSAVRQRVGGVGELPARGDVAHGVDARVGDAQVVVLLNRASGRRFRPGRGRAPRRWPRGPARRAAA